MRTLFFNIRIFKNTSSGCFWYMIADILHFNNNNNCLENRLGKLITHKFLKMLMFSSKKSCLITYNKEMGLNMTRISICLY